MSDLQQKFKSIIDELDKNLKNKEDIEYVKGQIYKICVMFLDEFDKLEEQNNQKIDNLVEKYAAMEERMIEMENFMDKLEKDIYDNEEDDVEEIEIKCPYCAADVIVDITDSLKNEISCPECNNIIELDWGNDEGCGNGCEHCHHHDEQEDEYEDDDM